MAKKRIDPNHLCMGCMGELEDVSRPCPHCGFSQKDYQRPSNSMPMYEILKGKYLLGRVLGVGGFGITYIGWDFYQGKRVCIKEYFPRGVASREGEASHSHTDSTTGNMSVVTQNSERARNAYLGGLQAYIKEAEMLSKFYRMPGIVSVRDFFYGNATAYIVMEYIEGMDLRQLAKANGKKLPPNVLFPLLKDVICALEAVHQAGILHRDISPDNIMVTPRFQAKVVDFGAAKQQGVVDNSILLKQRYAPPEQYDPGGNQGPWTDVYSLCATMYYLLTGKKIQKAQERLEQDKTHPLREMGVNVSPWEEKALYRGLQLSVRDRCPSMAELYRELYQEQMK